MQVLFQFANALGDPIEANPLGQQPPWAMSDAPYPINPGERGPITVLVCEVPEPPPFALAYGDGTATGTLTVAVNPSSPVPEISASGNAALSTYTLPKGQVVYLVTVTVQNTEAVL